MDVDFSKCCFSGLGYSFLKRGHTNLEMVGNAVGTYDLPGLHPDGVPMAINGEAYEMLNEPWYGITWAYKLSEHVGIGISQRCPLMVARCP